MSKQHTIDPGAWNDAAKNLAATMRRHEEAEANERAASSALALARSELCNAQKVVDQLVNSARASAPWNTDWHSGRSGVAA